MALLEGYSPKDKRNLVIYIAGIMLYKFALETLTGCVSSIVIKRTAPELGPNTMWTTMLAMNYACQCLGSILVAPLAKRYKTNSVLAWAIFLFGLLILIVPVLEFVTGGGRDSGLGDESKYSPGTWNPLILFAIFPLSGIFYGMVEITRRVIPSDIVGVDEHKLKHMDSLVHICYEVSGTAGALLSASFISYFNTGYALFIIPVLYTAAALVWYRIKLDRESDLVTVDDKPPFMQEMKSILGAFVHSVCVGAKLVMSRRSLVWLVLAYSLPLVLHRYLESVLFAQYANSGLNLSSYQQRLVAGSNLGELLGALFVLLFTRAVATPLPWLRIDAITLVIVWVFPYAHPVGSIDTWVWILFGIMVFVSFGWAAGDVSLVAYIQARLARINHVDHQTSALGAVMAFLYVLYIVMFAILSPLMGKVMDAHLSDLIEVHGSLDSIPHDLRLEAVKGAMVYTAGVFMTVCGVIIFAATFIPRGSFAFNPKGIDEETVCDQDTTMRKEVDGTKKVTPPSVTEKSAVTEKNAATEKGAATGKTGV